MSCYRCETGAWRKFGGSRRTTEVPPSSRDQPADQLTTLAHQPGPVHTSMCLVPLPLSLLLSPADQPNTFFFTPAIHRNIIGMVYEFAFFNFIILNFLLFYSSNLGIQLLFHYCKLLFTALYITACISTDRKHFIRNATVSTKILIISNRQFVKQILRMFRIDKWKPKGLIHILRLTIIASNSSICVSTRTQIQLKLWI